MAKGGRLMYETNLQAILLAQQGNEQAMQSLIEENNGLIWSIVKRFKDRGYEIEDLYQIGCMGFIKAIKRFDTSFEVRISTYAVPYILGEIKRFLRDDGPIKISRRIKELSIKIKELQKEYYRTKGEEITMKQIAEVLKVPADEIAMALDSTLPLESINEEAYGNDENSKETKVDKIACQKDEVASTITKLDLKAMIDSLKEREKEIIVLRFYKEKTQMEVAKILGITQVQVSRIEKKILGSMREKMIS